MNAPATTPSEFSDTSALDQLARDAAASEAETAAAAAPEQPAPAPKLTAANCMTEAGMLIGMGLKIIGQKLGVTFDADVKKDGQEKLAAVLAKYDGKLPDWFVKYQEEFQLGMWCAGVAWKCYEVAQEKKEQAAKPETQTGAEPGE